MAHVWYEDTSHRYTSPGTKVKVICKGQGQSQISGSCFSKDGCFGGISVSQTHLVVLYFCQALQLSGYYTGLENPWRSGVAGVDWSTNDC